MASHKAQRQQRATAKKKRRAARLKKRPQEDFTPIPLPETPAPAPATPSPFRSTVDTTRKNVEDFLPFPVWKYREKAKDPTRCPEDLSLIHI